MRERTLLWQINDSLSKETGQMFEKDLSYSTRIIKALSHILQRVCHE